jgi:hypothetical protein
MSIYTIRNIKMENQEVQQPQEEAQAPAAPELTIVDLQNIRSIIEVSSRRGAFAAGELEAVGTTFNKLARFLDAVAPAQAPAEGQAEPAPAQ